MSPFYGTSFHHFLLICIMSFLVGMVGPFLTVMAVLFVFNCKRHKDQGNCSLELMVSLLWLKLAMFDSPQPSVHQLA
jgi:hypothetical protein